MSKYEYQCVQTKLFDHDNVKYLKKILDELEKVMDQVETELQRRAEETPGNKPPSLATAQIKGASCNL